MIELQKFLINTPFMLSHEEAQAIANTYLPNAEVLELKQENEFWHAWRPGRTSIGLVIGADGGGLFYHIMQKSFDQAVADYQSGERSEIPDQSKIQPTVPPTPEESAEMEAERAVAQEKIQKMIDDARENPNTL